MSPEIEALRAELELLETELEQVKAAKPQPAEPPQVAQHRAKWTRKFNSLLSEFKDMQLQCHRERDRWERQLQQLNETLVVLKTGASKSEEAERQFLMQIDAELIALAGSAQNKGKAEQVSLEDDTIHESISEQTEHSEHISYMVTAIAKARETIKMLLERHVRKPKALPALSTPTPPNFDVSQFSRLTESYGESSLCSRVMLDKEVLDSLSVTEREAVVYSLINAGKQAERHAEVRLEDLLDVTDEKLGMEELSSIGSRSPRGSRNLMNRPMRFKFSPINSMQADSEVHTPLSQTNALNKGHYEESCGRLDSEDLRSLKADCKDFLKACELNNSDSF